MSTYKNNKRLVARGITIINNKVLLIERKKLENNKFLHYYTIPGGGIEEGETKETAVIRETFEETSVNTEIISYLDTEDYGNGICYWFHLKYISGIPTLGGEELERNNQNNYYEVKLIDIKDLDKIFIYGKGKELIKMVYKKELENLI